MIKEHYDAVRALLPSSVKVYMWTVPESPTFPYVALWGSTGDESSGGPDGDSLEDVPDVLSLNIRATYAGLTGDSMMIVCRNVRAALNRKKPVVPGWLSGKLRQSSLMDGQADLSISINGVHPVYAVDEYSLVSHKQ